MSRSKKGTTHLHAQLELLYKGRAKNGWLSVIVEMLLTLDLLNGLALRCYKPYPEL